MCIRTDWLESTFLHLHTKIRYNMGVMGQTKVLTSAGVFIQRAERADSLGKAGGLG